MIERFRGEYFYLSNMYPLDNPIRTEQGCLVLTSEHAYQAAKFEDPDIHKQVAQACADVNDRRIYADGLLSKELAKSFIEQGVPVRADWEIAKRGVMLVVVTRKFMSNPDLARKLALTGDQLIFEGNDWGDRYWGVDPIGSDNGENHLGKILMQVRRGLRSGNFDYLNKGCNNSYSDGLSFN